MSAETIRPSRLLNEKSELFGLSTMDFLVASYLFVYGQPLLKRIGLGPYAFLIPVVFLFVLAPIRIRYRRKIVRDGFRWALRKVLWNGRFHDPRT